MYVVDDVGATVTDPLVDCCVWLDETQEVAFVDVQDIETEEPLAIVIGPSEALALISTVGVKVHDCEMAGLFVVTPQLFASVTVRVCVLFTHVPQEPVTQAGVQSQVCVMAGLFVVTPQLFESVQVLVWLSA